MVIGDVLRVKESKYLSEGPTLWLRKGELCVIVRRPEWTGWDRVTLVLFTSSCFTVNMMIRKADFSFFFERITDRR